MRTIVLATAMALVSGCSAKDDAAGPVTNIQTTPGTTFVPPQDPGKGGFLVTASGEDLAIRGYDWSSGATSSGDPPAFVDGWQVQFRHVIITLDKIRLQAEPDKNPGNPEDMGNVVAEAQGPWAVDLSKGGPIIGKSQSPDEKTVALVAFPQGGLSLSDRYAFSYDIVPASSNAKLVNLDDDGRSLYEQAKANGWSSVYVGTATYKGPAPDAGSVFAKMPREVNFTLGMQNAASYINCENTDLNAVGDGFPRGVQGNAGGSTTVQITIHTDHLFWSRLNVEGTELHFDPFAAQASTYGSADKPGQLAMSDLANADITGFRTRDGATLPARSLLSDFAAPSGQLKYDPNGTSFAKVNSFASYVAYAAAAGGHLNADGKCTVRHRFVP